MRLDSLLELIKAYQDTQPPPKRTSKPKRRNQTGHMFRVGRAPALKVRLLTEN